MLEIARTCAPSLLLLLLYPRRRVVTQYGVDSLKNMEQLNKFAEIYIKSYTHTYIYIHKYINMCNLRENVLRKTLRKFLQQKRRQLNFTNLKYSSKIQGSWKLILF